MEKGSMEMESMGMGSMEKESMEMGTTHGMDHGPGTSPKPKDSMDHPSGMSEPTPSSGTTMNHGRHPMKRMGPDVHTMEADRDFARTGKKYDTAFRLLASDVSASKNIAVDGMASSRPWPPYAKLRAIKPTAFPKDKSVREIRLTLDGDMERYVWFLNNKPLSESDSIRIREGEIVRFIMINRTMMHHPMHLHGHFFRVINSQGDRSPLKHTVDVAPMSTTVIEFYTDEVGDWFFHCHLLYHMKSGMARVVHYEDFTLAPGLAAIRPNLYRDSWYFWGQANVLSNMTDGFLMLSNTRNILTAEWEMGWQDVDETEWEGIFTWGRYINRFFTVFAGADLLGEGGDSDKIRGLLGFHYLLPLNLESRAWIDTDGGARFKLDKSFELTPRLALLGDAQYDTHDKWEGMAGLSYTVSKAFSLIFKWHSDYGFGGGVQFRF
ncbi:MAG: multicopper oxidase domain-containing protein, partial [Nitrospirota bacterium]